MNRCVRIWLQVGAAFALLLVVFALDDVQLGGLPMFNSWSQVVSTVLVALVCWFIGRSYQKSSESLQHQQELLTIAKEYLQLATRKQDDIPSVVKDTARAAVKEAVIESAVAERLPHARTSG